MNAILTLPRKLAQQLFHHAQNGVRGGWIPNPSGGHIRAHVGAPPSDPKPFAVWYNHPQGPESPLVHERHPTAWTFIIALNTKGVLQLHAWRDGTETSVKIQPD